MCGRPRIFPGCVSRTRIERRANTAMEPSADAIARAAAHRATLAGPQGSITLFHLPFIELRRLHRRALQAQKRDQLEVVGLLVRADEKPNVLRLVFLENVSADPGRWEVRRDQIARVRRELRGRRLRVLGLFHSHPLTEAIVGVRDRQNTPTGWAHLVYDVCGLEPRLFIIRRRKGRRRVERLALSVGRSRRSSPPIVSRLTATGADGANR